METHYILLREHLIERRAGTFSTRGRSNQALCLEGSLWYGTPSSGPLTLLSHDFEGDVLECLSKDVERLSERQYDYLSAVNNCNDRIRQFRDKKWLSDVERVKVNDVIFLVNVTEVPDRTPAKVRYIGDLPTQSGLWFGVELSKQHVGRGRNNGTFKGQSFFHCPQDAGLFVSCFNVQFCPSPGLFQESLPRGFSTYRPPAREPRSSEAVYSNMPELPPLSIGERVVWISDTGPELGVVKWIGILPDARQKEYTIGIEFDNPVGTGTGKYNNDQLFRARQNHASLVPVLGLMKAEEYYGDSVPPVPEFPAPPPPLLPSPMTPDLSPVSQTILPASSVYEDFNTKQSTTVGFYCSSASDLSEDSSTAPYATVLANHSRNSSETSTSNSHTHSQRSIYEHHNPMYENVCKDSRATMPARLRKKDFASNSSFGSDRTNTITSPLPRQSSNPTYPAPYHAGNSVFYNRVNSESILSSEPAHDLNTRGTRTPSEGTDEVDHHYINTTGPGNIWRDRESITSEMADLRLSQPSVASQLSVTSHPSVVHASGTLPSQPQRVSNGTHARSGSHGATNIDADSQLMAVSSSAEGVEFEIGSMVEVVNGPPECRYGVVRWIGCIKSDPRKLIAGLEMEEESSAFTDGRFGSERCFHCPPNKAFFVFTHKLKRDQRFDESTSFIERRDSQVFGAMACPDVEGDIPPPSAGNLERFLGKDKGIQGHHNSCYMDSMLFAMFSFTMVFDAVLFRPRKPDDIKDYDKVQKVLREGIVNPLRANFFVRADKVLALRKFLDTLSSVKGLMTEEKDPEEFLNSLLQQTLKADPFIRLSSGQESFHYQLFVEKEEGIVLPTTQQLIELSFLQSDIKLSKTPACLILQMPRFGKDYKMYSRILPSLHLDITDIMQHHPRECTICGHLATHECKSCYQHFGTSLDKIAFCSNCLQKSHSHSKRANHSPRALEVDPDFLKHYKQHQEANVSIRREKLQLFAVICIETSHYVAFVKCGMQDDSPWVFFDSMADRMGAKHGYNVPEVQQCHFLPDWLKEDHRKRILQTGEDKQLPEQMRRLLCDSYICMYQSPSLMHYQ